jgi:hypothetical protein
MPPAGNRIELADLKERVRKLEALRDRRAPPRRFRIDLSFILCKRSEANPFIAL